VMLVVVTLAIGNLDEAAAAQNPFIFVIRSALGGRLGSALVWMVIGAMWFCGLSSVTSNSRMLFAFARDGGAPMSKPLARVSERHRTPAAAIWVCVTTAFMLAVWSRAYSVIVSISTIGLYAAYGIPIFLALRARRRGRMVVGPWNLGRWSTPINVGALIWVVLITVLFVLPPNERTGYTFAGLLVLLTTTWVVVAQDRFRGPPGLNSAP